MTSDFTIIIDSNEQIPYDFKSIKPQPETERIKLKTGDYSVKGMEQNVTVERKTPSDLFSSVGNGRARFEREMVRMSEMDYATIVIETSLAGIFMNPPNRSKMLPKAVFRTLLSWSVKYNIYVWPAWNREAGEKITYLLLKNFYENHTNGN